MRTTQRAVPGLPTPTAAGRLLAALVLPAAAALATAPAAGAAPAVTVVPGAGGPPVAIVWRTGRTIRGSAIDGSGARRLAVLRESSAVPATPSPDGRRIALVLRDRLLTVATDGSGAIRDRGPAPSASLVRWSPDGSRVAVIDRAGLDDPGLDVCAAGDGPAVGCARWIPDAFAEFGATWSPDGLRVAAVDGDGVLRTGDGRTTSVVERHEYRGDRIDYPFPPVWTRAGLTWSTLELRMEDGELAGVGRARIRRLEGATVRTLAVVPRRGRTFNPFAIGGELPDGTVIGVRRRYPPESDTASTFDLRRLRPGGSIGGTPVSAGPFEPGMGNASTQVAGTLADGRVALLVRGSESRPERLYLADPARGLGRRVALGDEIAVATALPGNPTDG